jgi:hypothetical protein
MAFGLLGDIGADALHGIAGLLGMGQPQPTAPQPAERGGAWGQPINFGGQWLVPQQPQSDASAAPAAEPAPPQPHEGFLSKAGHLLFGGGQGDPNDPLGRFRPGLVQEALGTAMMGGNPWASRDMLTRRNIAQAMLPYEMQNQALQAANQRAIALRLNRALTGAPQPAQVGAQQTTGGQPDAANGIQTADGAAQPSSAGGQGTGMPFDRDTLALMALGGDKNAQAAWQIGAPEWDIDRGTHVMYDKKTGATGRRISAKEYVNNYLVDPNDPNAPTYVPKLPEGTMPDGKGGIIQIPGFVAAQAQSAGATEAAKQAAAGPYDTVTINVNGVPTVVSKSQLAQMQGIVPGFASGPTPTPAQGTAPSAPATAPTPQGGSRSIPAQQAMQFYISKGYKPEQAAGIVGNLIGESGLDAGRTADDGSFGLAQWTGPRLQGLFAFAKANKLDPSDPNTQLEYSHYELTHGENAAGEAIRGAGNVDDATAAAAGYERPAGYTPQNPRGASGYGQRLSAAQQLVGGGGGATAQPAPANKPFIAQGVSPDVQKADQDAIAELRKDVEGRRLLASRANEFVTKMGNFATGPAYGGIHIPLTHSEFAPIKSVMSLLPDSGNKIDELDAISNSTWQDLRQQGSGGIRGFEAGGWKQAFPNIENYGPANVAIAKRLTAEQRQKEAELAFKEGWLQKYGSLSANGGADAAWSKMPIASNALAGEEQQQSKSRAPAPKLPPRAPALPQGRQPPAAAVADLKRDPSPQARAEFDQVFGPGSAKRVLGGA